MQYYLVIVGKLTNVLQLELSTKTFQSFTSVGGETSEAERKGRSIKNGSHLDFLRRHLNFGRGLMTFQLFR